MGIYMSMGTRASQSSPIPRAKPFSTNRKVHTAHIHSSYQTYQVYYEAGFGHISHIYYITLHYIQSYINRWPSFCCHVLGLFVLLDEMITKSQQVVAYRMGLLNGLKMMLCAMTA